MLEQLPSHPQQIVLHGKQLVNGMVWLALHALHNLHHVLHLQFLVQQIQMH